MWCGGPNVRGSGSVILSAIIGALSIANPALAQQHIERTLNFSVDPRVELMSIVFNLSGAPEYNQGVVESYNQAVAVHFGAFGGHPVVQRARSLRARTGVSFDAPISLAVNLPDSTELSFELAISPRPAGLDARWPGQETLEFITELESFADQSRFMDFFESQSSTYERILQRLETHLNGKIDPAWFGDFFGGNPPPEFRLIVSPSSTHNYGPRVVRPDGETVVYCVLGVWQVESGEAVFENVTPTVIHEFTHSYVNPLVERYEEQLRESGEKLHSYAGDAEGMQTYGTWYQMICESLVRASVVRYRLRFEGEDAVRDELRLQEHYGFVWTEDLSELLGEYESSRDAFPTLESFMPRVVSFFSGYELGLWDRAKLQWPPWTLRVLPALLVGIGLGFAFALAGRFFRKTRS